MKPELSIVIPTYNEADRIRSTLTQLVNYLKKEKIDAEVLVVDAQSPDGTARIVEEYIKKIKFLRLIDAGPKPGGRFIKGRQVKQGMLEAQGKYVLFMDADLATPLKYIKSAVNDLKIGKQVVICVRDLQTSHQGVRKFVSGAGNLLVQMMLLPGIKDTQCGFKAFSREATRVIFLSQTIDGWGFDMEVLAIARKRGYSIGLIEVPDWEDIKEGSKISGSSPIKASLQTFVDLIKIRWGFLRGRYKVKK